RTLSPRSMARKLSTLRTLFRMLKLARKASENIPSYIRSPKFFKALPPILTPQEMDGVLDYAAERSSQAGTTGSRKEQVQQALQIRNQCMIELLYSSGMRVSELLSLNTDQMSADEL